LEQDIHIQGAYETANSAVTEAETEPETQVEATPESEAQPDTAESPTVAKAQPEIAEARMVTEAETAPETQLEPAPESEEPAVTEAQPEIAQARMVTEAETVPETQVEATPESEAQPDTAEARMVTEAEAAPITEEPAVTEAQPDIQDGKQPMRAGAPAEGEVADQPDRQKTILNLKSPELLDRRDYGPGRVVVGPVSEFLDKWEQATEATKDFVSDEGQHQPKQVKAEQDSPVEKRRWWQWWRR